MTQHQGLVDFHQHAMPLPVLEWLAARGDADLAGLDSGYVQLDPAVSGVPAGARIPLPASQYDSTLRLAELDELGVERACVSLPPFLIASQHSDGAFVQELVARGNRALVEWCSGSDGRLIPLPTVPLGLQEYASDTWDRLGASGHVGVALGTGGLFAELDDERHEPIWATLAETGQFAFLHPSQCSSPARHAKYWLTQLMGYPAETALATARLILSGALERHEFKMILAHGGGSLPSVAGRLDLGWREKDQTRTVPHTPSSYLSRLYYDSATFSAAALTHVISLAGPGHIVVGTDWPFDLADARPGESLHAAGGEELIAATRETAATLLAGAQRST